MACGGLVHVLFFQNPLKMQISKIIFAMDFDFVGQHCTTTAFPHNSFGRQASTNANIVQSSEFYVCSPFVRSLYLVWQKYNT